MKKLIVATLLLGSGTLLSAQKTTKVPAHYKPVKSEMYRKGWIDFNKNGVKDIYEDPAATLDDRIENLLQQMTLEEKTCQMVTLYGYKRVLKDDLPTPEWKQMLWKDGIGAMIDFGPLLSNPKMFLFGAAAQFGIFFTIVVAAFLGFDIRDAASIGIIGAADGPTSILVSQVLKSNYIGPIAVAAYSYMALVPIIQPMAVKAVTTKKERMIKMPYQPGKVSRFTRIAFPIIVTFIAGLVAPASVSLVGFLMFGNLIRECGCLNSLSETAQHTLANLITLLLGITISFSMRAEQFVTVQTLMIMVLGLFAFIFDTVGGVLFAKFLNLFSKNKINPMIGAAGISAFPMSARVIEKMGIAEDSTNHLLMHAIGANVSGQVASAVAGGIVLGFFM